MNNILICGNYGATNIGDELILKGLLQSLQCHSEQAHPNRHLRVLSYKPKQTEELHGVKAIYFLPSGFRSILRSLTSLSLFKTLKSFWWADEFVLGGGGLMQDEHPRAILIWGIHLLLAIILRKKIRILANSVGPLDRSWARGLVRWLFNHADEITVRDQASKELLKKIAVKKEVRVADDYALFSCHSGLDPESISAQSKDSKYIILSLRDWLSGRDKEKFESELLKLINYFIQELGYKIIALPFENLHDKDAEYLMYIQGLVPDKNMFHVQKYCSDFDKIFALYQSAEFVVGMRLHSIILAHKFKKPFLALSYSSKVRDFCRQLGKDKDCYDLDDFMFDKILKNILISATKN